MDANHIGCLTYTMMQGCQLKWMPTKIKCTIQNMVIKPTTLDAATNGCKDANRVGDDQQNGCQPNGTAMFFKIGLCHYYNGFDYSVLYYSVFYYSGCQQNGCQQMDANQSGNANRESSGKACKECQLGKTSGDDFEDKTRCFNVFRVLIFADLDANKLDCKDFTEVYIHGCQQNGCQQMDVR